MGLAYFGDVGVCVSEYLCQNSFPSSLNNKNSELRKIEAQREEWLNFHHYIHIHHRMYEKNKYFCCRLFSSSLNAPETLLTRRGLNLNIFISLCIFSHIIYYKKRAGAEWQAVATRTYT
jgi:hypothetical protein